MESIQVEKSCNGCESGQCDAFEFMAKNLGLRVLHPGGLDATELLAKQCGMRARDSNKRLMFEPNEIEFAQDFKICVLSTSELFKAVVHVLDGKKLSRNEIEKEILEANPICKLVK